MRVDPTGAIRSIDSAALLYVIHSASCRAFRFPCVHLGGASVKRISIASKREYLVGTPARATTVCNDHLVVQLLLQLLVVFHFG